mmetsp:Transcript_10688/g.22231  ORF Transcript_10688/g.22231 Transcript_10688/m.22231 type:complete len:377 (-) Transcript_10688:420-1550(-)
MSSIHIAPSSDLVATSPDDAITTTTGVAASATSPSTANATDASSTATPMASGNGSNAALLISQKRGSVGSINGVMLAGSNNIIACRPGKYHPGSSKREGCGKQDAHQAHANHECPQPIATVIIAEVESSDDARSPLNREVDNRVSGRDYVADEIIAMGDGGGDGAGDRPNDDDDDDDIETKIRHRSRSGILRTSFRQTIRIEMRKGRLSRRKRRGADRQRDKHLHPRSIAIPNGSPLQNPPLRSKTKRLRRRPSHRKGSQRGGHFSRDDFSRSTGSWHCLLSDPSAVIRFRFPFHVKRQRRHGNDVPLSIHLPVLELRIGTSDTWGCVFITRWDESGDFGRGYPRRGNREPLGTGSLGCAGSDRKSDFHNRCGGSV